ncbi:MAG TPA: ATPase [Chitinophagaceae bacterium]|jgi:NadR type nicotinamide-nucleotide adenylyltransferase|nr:ATPase [Chitinophagaceae bacterium]NBY25210.1 ATPase [Chitinophagaceae bacterium]NCW88518.1 ATPase [Chitinophagia bacterium]HAL95928.1 ATPase [Chitinophagaceae bacterium]
MLKKIVVIGPESTGKSTLCRQLAEHFETVWCPEYAREYLLTNGKDYSYTDLLTIAKGQIAGEENWAELLEKRAAPLLEQDYDIPYFIDTNMVVMKVWAEFVFNKCHPYIEEQLAKRKYDHYLLCQPDLEWEKDELREYPDLETRERLFFIYKNYLEQQSVPWTLIKGKNDDRIQSAIRTVNTILESSFAIDSQ